MNENFLQDLSIIKEEMKNMDIKTENLKSGDRVFVFPLQDISTNLEIATEYSIIGKPDFEFYYYEGFIDDTFYFVFEKDFFVIKIISSNKKNKLIHSPRRFISKDEFKIKKVMKCFQIFYQKGIIYFDFIENILNDFNDINEIDYFIDKIIEKYPEYFI
jgi:hypothetical protein